MVTVGKDGSFDPLHDAHAIELLVATVQFAHPLPDEIIRSAISAVDSFKESLPGQQELRGMGFGFQFGPGGLASMPPSFGGPPDGRVRYKTDAAGVMLNELRVDRQTLVFRTQAYTRWDAVWDEAQSYFAAVLPAIGVDVTSIGLQYIDKFIWVGAPEACRPADLLRQDSPYVTRRVFEAQDLWHCNSGQFRAASAQIKRLEVVDINCLDEAKVGDSIPSSMQRFVRISTAVTDFFNQVGYEPFPVSGDAAVEQVRQTFPILHQELKRVISEILNNENARRIGMTKNATE